MTGRTTRRGFIEGSGKAAVGLGMFNTLAARSARADDPPKAAGKLPVVGLIGCGGMGNADLGWHMDHKVPIAAVCDVDSQHAGQTADRVEKKQGHRPAIFGDFRKLLERKDIDAVIIATPDHWHALPMIAACDAGKDVYLEKPISHDITEGRAMVSAARRNKTVVQVGTWQRSTKEFVDAVDYIRAGRLGKVTTARAWKVDTFRLGHNPPKPVPKELDYDFWVGPAKMVPYTGVNCHFTWRWFYNTGVGMVGDWGVHMMDIVLLAMSKDTDLVMPEQVSAFGGNWGYPGDDRNTPDTLLALMKFPHFVMQWETNRVGLDAGPEHGTEFIAADGSSLMVWRGGWTVKDPDGRPLPKTEDPAFHGVYDHTQNYLDCIVSRAQPRSNIFSMYQTTVTCHLANASYLAGTAVRWSKAQNDIVGAAGKDTIPYAREYRKPWCLPSA